MDSSVQPAQAASDEHLLGVVQYHLSDHPLMAAFATKVAVKPAEAPEERVVTITFDGAPFGEAVHFSMVILDADVEDRGGIKAGLRHCEDELAAIVRRAR